MKKSKRNLADYFLNFCTYLSSGLALIVLILIIGFIFQKGHSVLSMDLLTKPYWSSNYIVEMKESESGNFIKPDDLNDNVYFSRKWGIAFKDDISHEKQDLILVEYIDENSPFQKLYNVSAGENYMQNFTLEKGSQIEKLTCKDKDGNLFITGTLNNDHAKDVVKNLDEKAEVITGAYIKTLGGGIKGSLISTLYLIFVSLLIALPIGVGSAIYLNEYAKRNRWNFLIRNGIETLSGVPSIVYGLLGLTMLYPITKLFHATSVNLLLGALTLSIMLLPTIIRSCEEALLVVPQSLRDASYSLGATKFQTILKVVLPNALSGILTGILLSIGRVIGESAALIYTTGTYINDHPTLMTQGTSLAVHIWTLMSGEMPNYELASAISLVILVIVLILNVGVKLIGKKWNKERC